MLSYKKAFKKPRYKRCDRNGSEVARFVWLRNFRYWCYKGVFPLSRESAGLEYFVEECGNNWRQVGVASFIKPVGNVV